MLSQEEKFSVCQLWLQRGFRLLPIQPNSKYLIAGFGEHKKQIVDTVQAEEMLELFPSCNLAVLRDKKKTILDFDEPMLYCSWVEEHPEEAKTYTERTPRNGAHVFADGPAPAGLIWRKGIEEKKICLIYPSVVNDKAYIQGDGEILKITSTDFFSGLSEPGTRTAYVLKCDQLKRDRIPYGSSSVIEQIKHRFTIEYVFLLYKPGTDLSGKTPFISVLCPFHPDHHASMFLDLQRQLFKCHACDAHGDVINLYAMFEKITVREAIARMSKMLHG